MIEPLFTSTHGGSRLRRRVLEALDEALATAGPRRLDLHMMAFSFTDEAIAGRIVEIAEGHTNVSVRVVADWSQSSSARGQQVAPMARRGLPNLRVRYKIDQPYQWDASKQRLNWSYRTSRGLLHHKTLGIHIDGRPWKLVCGSFNWTRNASRSYENLLVVTGGTPASNTILVRMDLEFQALWRDGRATLSPPDAAIHRRMIEEFFRSRPSANPRRVRGLLAGTPGGPIPVHLDPLQDDGPEGDAATVVAFSSRCAHQRWGRRGYAKENSTQRFLMQKTSGRTKRVPVTLSTLALDTIFRAGPGDTLKVALYGMSRRVPAYGALLDAARRGVRVRIILDGGVGRDVVAAIERVSAKEDLPLKALAGRRTMHQKYIVHPESGTALTGTANMTVDASDRHSEHLIRIRRDHDVANAFVRDFDTIWGRVSRGR